MRLSLNLLSFLVAALCFISTAAAAEPHELLDRALGKYRQLPVFRAHIRRVQQFRSTKRVAQGTLLLDRTRGALYDYRAPGRYTFFSGDTLVYGVAVKKHRGWMLRGACVTSSIREQYDPVFRLLQIAGFATSSFTYRGETGSLLIFSRADEQGGGELSIGIDPVHLQCNVIERIGHDGTLTQKTELLYRNKENACSLPMVLCMHSFIGGETVDDSLYISNLRCDVAIKPECFNLPTAIVWRLISYGDCSAVEPSGDFRQNEKP